MRVKDKKKARHEKKFLKQELRLFCKAMKTMKKSRLIREKRLALNKGENIIKYPLEESILFHSMQELTDLSDEEQDPF